MFEGAEGTIRRRCGFKERGHSIAFNPRKDVPVSTSVHESTAKWGGWKQQSGHVFPLIHQQKSPQSSAKATDVREEEKELWLIFWAQGGDANVLELDAYLHQEIVLSAADSACLEGVVSRLMADLIKSEP